MSTLTLSRLLQAQSASTQSSIRRASSYARADVFQRSLLRPRLQIQLPRIARTHVSQSAHLSAGSLSYARSARPSSATMSRHAEFRGSNDTRRALEYRATPTILQSLSHVALLVTLGLSSTLWLVKKMVELPLGSLITDILMYMRLQVRTAVRDVRTFLQEDGISSKHNTVSQQDDATWNVTQAREAALRRLESLLPSQAVAHTDSTTLNLQTH